MRFLVCLEESGDYIWYHPLQLVIWHHYSDWAFCCAWELPWLPFQQATTLKLIWSAALQEAPHQTWSLTESQQTAFKLHDFSALLSVLSRIGCTIRLILEWVPVPQPQLPQNQHALQIATEGWFSAFQSSLGLAGCSWCRCSHPPHLWPRLAWIFSEPVRFSVRYQESSYLHACRWVEELYFLRWSGRCLAVPCPDTLWPDSFAFQCSF